jgi:hypothetical protein
MDREEIADRVAQRVLVAVEIERRFLQLLELRRHREHADLGDMVAIADRRLGEKAFAQARQEPMPLGVDRARREAVVATGDRGDLQKLLTSAAAVSASPSSGRSTD